MNICELSPCKYKPTLNHFWLNNTLTFFSLYCFNKYKLNINWYFNPCVSVWTFWIQQIKWIIVITPQLQLLRSINSPVCLRSLFQFFNFLKWFLFIIQHFWQFNINRDYSWLILVFCLCPFGRFEGLVFFTANISLLCCFGRFGNVVSFANHEVNTSFVKISKFFCSFCIV